MGRTEDRDIIVVGGGTSGTFAAGTAASKGLDVAILERKNNEEAGHIACGDAVHNPLNREEFPEPFNMKRVADKAEADTAKIGEEDTGNLSLINRGLYWDEELGVEKEIDFAGNPGNVVDRHAWGKALLDEAEKQGADIIYDTVVNDVIQNDQVEGVKAVTDGETIDYRADLVVDAAGALSIVQDNVDFENTGFEKPYFQQFGSAYREVIETEEPVDYDDALVVKPLANDIGMGYIWYFPRSPTEINVGLGFQMSETPFPMVEALREDIEDRPEYQNATVKNKLGSALGLRRPLDSAVAPGYIAVGDAAGMVSPTTGKGITGAAISGHSAGEVAAEAVIDADVSEENLWRHNHTIFSENGEGARLAKQDAYNVAASGYTVDELRGAVALLPVGPMMDGISGSSDSYSVFDKLRIGAELKWNGIKHGLNGNFDKLDATQERSREVITELAAISEPAEQLKKHYQSFPRDRKGYETWLEERDRIDQEILELSGADPKY